MGKNQREWLINMFRHASLLIGIQSSNSIIKGTRESSADRLVLDNKLKDPESVSV